MIVTKAVRLIAAEFLPNIFTFSLGFNQILTLG